MKTADLPRYGASLSIPELRVLHLLAQGLDNVQIGFRLHLAEGTVKTHLRRLFSKLGAANRAHAVALGFQGGHLVAGTPRIRPVSRTRSTSSHTNRSNQPTEPVKGSIHAV